MIEPGFTVIGEIVRPQGVSGEVRILPMTMEPDRFLSLKSVFISQKNNTGTPNEKRNVERAYLTRNMIVLKLSGCKSFEDAELLRGYELKVPDSERIELGEGAYFWHDLVGMQVVGDRGEKLGAVTSVFPTGSNDVLVVGEGESEILLPFIADVILDVDVDEKKILVHLLEGLI